MGGDRRSLSDVGAARSLADQAEDELRAAVAGDLDELERLTGRRADLIAALSERPHPASRAELEAAHAAQSAVTAALGRLRDEVAAELREIAGKRRTAGGYARVAGATPHGGTLDAAG